MNIRTCLFIIILSLTAFWVRAQSHSKMPSLQEVKSEWLEHWKEVKPYFKDSCNSIDWAFRYVDSMSTSYNSLAETAKNISDSLKAKESYLKMIWETDEVIIQFQFIIVGLRSMTIISYDPFEHKMGRSDLSNSKSIESILDIFSNPCTSCSCHKEFGTIISKIVNGKIVATRINW